MNFLLSAALPPAYLVAASTDTGLPLWGQLGIAAVFVFAFITLQIVPGGLYKRLETELKEERAHSRALEASIKDQVLPLMIKVTDTMQRFIEVEERRAERNRDR